MAESGQQQGVVQGNGGHDNKHAQGGEIFSQHHFNVTNRGSEEQFKRPQFLFFGQEAHG